MDSNVLEFLGFLGQTIGKGLANFIIPGTNWSALGLMLGCLLLGFAIKLLFSIFSALNVSGGFSSAGKAYKANKGLKNRSEAHRQAEHKRIWGD